MKIRYLPQPNIKAKYNNYAARVITQILKVNLLLFKYVYLQLPIASPYF